MVTSLEHCPKKKIFWQLPLYSINCQNLKIHTAGTRARRWPLRSAPWLACFHFKKACDYHQKQHKRFPHFKCRGPTKDIIMYFNFLILIFQFTLMFLKSDLILFRLDIILHYFLQNLFPETGESREQTMRYFRCRMRIL